MMDLESAIEGNAYLLFELHSKLGVDVDGLFEIAANDESLSMSYPEHRAERMWERVLVNAGDEEAWEELAEFSPGADWSGIRKRIHQSAIEFDVRTDTNEQLYQCAVERLGAEAAHALLERHGILGTYSHEPISEAGEQQALSLVVFDPKRIRILEVEPVRLHDPRRESEPGPGEP
jgi:hypothetical protein